MLSDLLAIIKAFDIVVSVMAPRRVRLNFWPSFVVATTVKEAGGGFGVGIGVGVGVGFGVADGLGVVVIIWVKVAVTEIGPLIVIYKVVALLVMSPVQLLKVQPNAGVAVRAMVSP